MKNKRTVFGRLLRGIAVPFLTAVLFSALHSLTADAAAGKVTLSENGMLMLSGEVTKEQLEEYQKNTTFNYVYALPGTVLPEDCSYLFRDYYVNTINLSNADTSNVTDMSYMFYDCRFVTSIDMGTMNTARLNTVRGMFYGCSDLVTLKCLSWDTSQVTDMSHLFYFCTDLQGLTLTGLNTSRVTDMSWMFASCSSLVSLNLGSLDTSHVTDMAGMFYFCEKLSGIDVSTLDTSQVTNMANMFSSCTALRSLDLSGFDTSHVKNMAKMFYFCRSLTSLDLSSFDTSQVTNMNSMFTCCFDLTTLDLSSFDTSNVTDMGSMFYDNESLSSLDLRGFHTAKVTNMSNMFRSCRSIYTLDLCSFDTSNVAQIDRMFLDCSRLYRILVSDRWNTDNAESSDSMFAYCSKLYGGKGTRYDSDMTDNTYARIDRPGQPGYLTDENFFIRKDSVTLSKTVFPYTGKEVKVGNYITVKVGGKKLKYNTDFILFYYDEDIVDCGVNTASVEIYGIGEYSGSVTKYYTIVPKKLAQPELRLVSPKGIRAEWVQDENAAGYQVEACKNSSFSPDDPSYHTAYYNASRSAGSMSYPLPGEKWYIRVRAYIKDSSNEKYGIWSDPSSITVKGKVTDVTLSKTVFAYTGKEVKAGSYITVKSGDTKLKYGTDFTMTYAENVNCGANTASVTITGIGNYTGNFTKNFSIVPAKQAAPKLSTKSGMLHIEWTSDSNAQGYQIQYCQNSSFTGDTLHSASFAADRTSTSLMTYPKPGETWYVRVRATVKNSSGTNYGTWSDAKCLTIGTIDNVTLSRTEFAYTGKAVKVGSYLTVRSGDTALKYGTDFTLSYKNNVSKGTAAVTVIGIGEYDGSSVTKEYRIK